MLNLHNLHPAEGSRKKKKRVGRGNASGSGTYSGRGIKGQKARSGGKSGLAKKAAKQFLQKIPKLKGFKSLRPKVEIVNLRDLERLFADGHSISIADLLKSDLIKTAKNGVKILGDGKLTKKFTIKAHQFSKTAEDAIIKAGGKIEKIVKEIKKDKAKKA